MVALSDIRSNRRQRTHFLFLGEETKTVDSDLSGETVGDYPPVQRIVEHELSDQIWKKNCKPCTRIYQPVCGSDGEEERVFGSQCEMDFVNCFESRSEFRNDLSIASASVNNCKTISPLSLSGKMIIESSDPLFFYRIRLAEEWRMLKNPCFITHLLIVSSPAIY